MARFEDLAKYISQLLGNEYDIKYFSNKEIDWEKIVIADDMIYGSMRVLNGQNNALKGVGGIMLDELGITFAIKEENYGEKLDHIDAMFKSINKELILIGEEYAQFDYSYHSDLGTTIIKGERYNTTTFYINTLTFGDLFLSDSQYVSIEVNGTYEKLLGVTGITGKTQWSFDGAVNQVIQKQYVAGVSEDIVIDGVMVKDDTARLYIKSNKLTNINYSVKYFDGESTETITMKLGTYLRLGVVGNLVKYQIVLVRKQ